MKKYSKEFFVDLFSTATYGSEWFEIRTLKSERHLDEEKSFSCIEERWYNRLISGGHIVLVDYYPCEDDEPAQRLSLTMDEFKERFEKAIELCPRDYGDLMSGDGDYYSANNLMQVVFFGEVIYG